MPIQDQNQNKTMQPEKNTNPNGEQSRMKTGKNDQGKTMENKDMDSDEKDSCSTGHCG